MSNFAYVAISPQGREMRGSLEVPDQSEALRRIKEMGLFPTRIWAPHSGRTRPLTRPPTARGWPLTFRLPPKVRAAKLATFTRQLATLVEAGLPLLRGLKLLQEQEETPAFKRVIGEFAESIENGSSCAEALAAHPSIFNKLYVNMVKAGEISGALETTLNRLADFMEKSQKIRGKVKAALWYPGAVLTVAFGIIILLMTFIVPRFKEVFDGLMNGQPLPAFTRFIFHLSETVKHQLPLVALMVGAVSISATMALKTAWGRWTFDSFKLAMPVLGTLFRKVAISRFARTLGTLTANGVPILQALTIVRDTAGSVPMTQVITRVHDCVKQGDPIAPSLKASSLFPAMVAGMVDVGEQTGALPDMLMKIADNYEDEVDNAAGALTSLLEPLLLVFLAVVVGSIVIAMFLPIITVATGMDAPTNPAN